MNKIKLVLFAIVCITLALVVFPLPQRGGFVSDDWDWLSTAERRPDLASVLTLNSTGSHTGGSYNPVSSLWVHSLYRFFGTDPRPFHVASISLHGMNAFLVALLFMNVMSVFFAHEKTRYYAYGVGIIFLLWPTHVEAVQWIAAVPHLLATFFSLLALNAYLSWRKALTSQKLLLIVILSLCALFSKEIALGLPLIFCCLEFWFNQSGLMKERRMTYAIVASLFAAAAVYLILRFAATGIVLGSYAEQQLIIRPWQVINTFLTFFEEFFTLGTGRALWMQWFWHHTYVAAITGLGSVVVLWLALLRSRIKAVLLWWYVFLLSLVPFLALGFNRLSQEGERYTYLPSVFFLVFAGTFLYEFGRRFSWALFLLLLCATIQPLSQRMHAWDSAFQVADTIVDEIRHLPKLLESSQLYLLVGLPDTIGGAHVFRNNLTEAVRLSGIEYRARIVPLPIYTQFAASEAHASLLYWTSDDRGLFAKNLDHRLVVTGIARRESDYLTHELWNYDYDFFSSDTIRLLYRDHLKQDIAQGDASILTWDGGKLQDVTNAPQDFPTL